MAIRRTGQLGFSDAVIEGAASPLDRIAGLVRWDRFEQLVGGLRQQGPGRPAWPALVLFKALLVGALYGLSERELEAALADRLSFRRFVGLSYEETVPDHSVLNRFRAELV
jgi:IS5 family transposase